MGGSSRWAAILPQLRAELGGQAQQHFQKIASGRRGGAGGCGGGGGRADAGGGANALRHTRGKCACGPQTRRRGRRHRALRKPDHLEFRQAARVARNSPRRADAVRLSRAGGSRHALRRRSVRFTRRSRADPSRRLAASVRAAAEGADQVSWRRTCPACARWRCSSCRCGTQEELRDQIIDTALDRACLQDPLPDDDATFHTRRDEGKRPPDLAGTGDRAAGRADSRPNTRACRRSWCRRSRSLRLRGHAERSSMRWSASAS